MNERHLSGDTVEHRKSSVVVRADDPSLTGSAGMVCVAEAIRALGLIDAIDGFVGPIKQRDRGLSAGQFVVSLAECLLGGGDYMVDLDRARPDVAAAALRAVPVPPASTTAPTLAQRFGVDELAGVEAAWAETTARALDLADPAERARLRAQRPTVDVDSTEIEVFGRHKGGVAYNYLGQLAGRVLFGDLGRSRCRRGGRHDGRQRRPPPGRPRRCRGCDRWPASGLGAGAGADGLRVL